LPCCELGRMVSVVSKVGLELGCMVISLAWPVTQYVVFYSLGEARL
jgi:hypothetical protein